MSPTTRWAARARLLVARHRAVRWVALVTCAAGAAWGTAATLAAPARERAAWGASAVAWVATRDLAAGEPIVAERLHVPAALLPPAALPSLAPSESGPPVAAAPIGEGEILVGDDVAGHGPWALVPPGWRVLAVERRPAMVAVQAGDHVDAYASVGALASEALVVAVSADAVTIAVAPDDAAATATAATDPTFVLALISAHR